MSESEHPDGVSPADQQTEIEQPSAQPQESAAAVEPSTPAEQSEQAPVHEQNEVAEESAESPVAEQNELGPEEPAAQPAAERNELADEQDAQAVADLGAALIEASKKAEEEEEALEPPAPEPIPTQATAPAEDPELDEVEAATIDQPGDEESEPFEKLAAKARRLSLERVRTILESLLFVTDRPMTEEALRQATGISVQVIREQLQKLQGSYRDGVRGIVLHEVSGGWQFRTDPTNSDYVRRFLKVKPQRLTRAALETLAIIAYRQPVTRPEIEDIRAVDCGAVVKALLERHLIKIIGKRDEPGRPMLYGTTPEFLEFFNLRDLGSLPTLREFQELSEESRDIVEKEIGEAEAAPQPGTDTIVADLKDNTFEQKLQATTAEADAALVELESALADSEEKTRETQRILNPQQPQGPQDEAADDEGDTDGE